MDWARKRRLTVILILAATVLAIIAIAAFAIFYHTPTCTDHTQDQGETGIDCGGPCTTLCTNEASAATVRFVRTLAQSGRTDAIAYVDNPNRTAFATNAAMTLEAYATDGTVARTHLQVDMAPGATVPVFVPGILPAGLEVRQAFLSFDDGSPLWMRALGAAPLPLVSDITTRTLDTAPRITAILANQTAHPVYNTTVTATVFGADGTVIAASQTLVPTLPAQGTAPLIFTWSEPFTAPVVRVDIIPNATAPRRWP